MADIERVSQVIDLIAMSMCKPRFGRLFAYPEEVGDAIRAAMKDTAIRAHILQSAWQGIGGCHGLDTPDRVRFYEHDFYVLSNFSAFVIEWDGRTFPTSEHAYHWEKFGGSGMVRAAHRGNILQANSAHEAFKYAEKFKEDRRANWDAVKVCVMRDILRTKVDQHEYVKHKLLATGDRELVEDSWRDDYWGWGPNRDGQNMLGKLWMEIREELRLPLPPTGGSDNA